MNRVISRLVIVVAILFMFLYEGMAQQRGEVRIGDSLPKAFLPEIIKYNAENGRLSEFTDKALLIDFWFTNCGACIAKFPFLDSISQEYRDNLQILQVTRDSKQKVMDFFTRSDRWKHIDFPCVVNDSAMNALFPHRTEPHYVWVGRDGVVKAITDGEAITRENLSALAENRPFEVPLKAENLRTDQYWGLYPLMMDYPEVKDELLSYSFLAKSKGNGFRAGVHDVNPVYDTKEKYFRLRQLGTTMTSLYGVAYGLSSTQDFHATRIVWETSDGERYKPDFDKQKHVYDYDLIVRDTVKATFFRQMRADLDKCFGLKSSLEKRSINVLILKKTGHSDAFMSKDKDAVREQYVSGDMCVIRNIPMFAVLGMFNSEISYQVFNETGYNGQISIEVYMDTNNMEKVRNSFQRYGLDLVLVQKEVDVIVLKD